MFLRRWWELVVEEIEDDSCAFDGEELVTVGEEFCVPHLAYQVLDAFLRHLLHEFFVQGDEFVDGERLALRQVERELTDRWADPEAMLQIVVLPSMYCSSVSEHGNPPQFYTYKMSKIIYKCFEYWGGNSPNHSENLPSGKSQYWPKGLYSSSASVVFRRTQDSSHWNVR
jgi:hypothetical protein